MLVKLVLIFSLINGSSVSSLSNDFITNADTVKKVKTVVKPDTIIDGKFFTVNRIIILGNRITRDRIILRELTLKTGDIVFSGDIPSILEVDRRRLMNTRLFNAVKLNTLESDPSKIDLIIETNERWYTFPVPLFELADRNFNEWWQNYNHDLSRVNYGARLYQYNMRGRNETLRLHAQFGFQRRFEFLYRIPYIDQSQKQGLVFDYTYLETRNLAFQTLDHKYDFLKADHILRTMKMAGFTYTYRNSFYQTHALRFETFNCNVDDTIKLLNPLYLKGEKLDQQYTAITYTFSSDHRDLINYPLRGHQFTGAITKYGLLPSDELNKIEASLSYARYAELKNNYYLSNNTVLYTSDPQDISYLNYWALGFRKQFVRGYELYIIEGPHFVLNKTTFKKLIFSKNYNWKAMPLEQFRHVPLAIYLKTYADFGYVKNYPDYERLKFNTRLTDKLISGTGLGIDIVGSYDVVIRLEYTVNSEKEHGFFFHLKREF